MTHPNIQLSIDDQWTDAADGRTIAVLNPADGQVIGTVAHGSTSTSDPDRAPAAAAADLLRERADSVARVISLEEGQARWRSSRRSTSSTGSPSRSSGCTARGEPS